MSGTILIDDLYDFYFFLCFQTFVKEHVLLEHQKMPKTGLEMLSG